MSMKKIISSGNLYRSLFNSIKDCVALYEVVNDGENFKFVDLNRSAEKSESIKKEEVVGKLVTDVFPAVKDFGIFQVFQDVYRDGVARLFPITFYADNRIGGWRENYIYKLDENHIFAVYNDVTKEKQAEADLKLSAKVFETSLEGVLIADRDVNIIKVNSAFCDMSGYTQKELIGTKANVLKSSIYKDSFYKEMWESIYKDGLWQGEIWDRRKNGESFAVFLSISVIYDDDKEIKNYIGVYLDITEKKKYQDHIFNLAYYDTLTKLPNREHFDSEIGKYIERAKQNSHKFALLFLDLDNFKYINDTFGHNIGDKLLIEVANRLENTLKEHDFIARVGGDEFIVILDNIEDNKEIVSIANKILSLFENEFNIDNNIFQIGCSIGISIYPTDGKGKNTLLKGADTAMYQSKKYGKNCFHFHSPDMNREFIRKLELAINMREAIRENQFELFYQPKILVSSEKAISAEALIRWNSHTLGFVSPTEFIPYAEETNLIIAIGDFVLESACKTQKELEDLGSNISIAINISSVQLNRDNFIDKVKTLIDKIGCNPKRLEFEITESKIMDNVELNIKKLNELKEMGISISIDDFGTGYSSMNYLQKLPINVIKIDKSFIDNTPHTKDGNLIVKGIISLAKALSLDVVAEGVEDTNQRDFLKENHCDIIQGYLYSRPLNKSDFFEYINNN